MKTDIKELWLSNANITIDEDGLVDEDMSFDGFRKSIIQAELKWYKKMESCLTQMIERQNTAFDVRFYCEGIQNKIKELENEN